MANDEWPSTGTMPVKAKSSGGFMSAFEDALSTLKAHSESLRQKEERDKARRKILHAQKLRSQTMDKKRPSGEEMLRVAREAISSPGGDDLEPGPEPLSTGEDFGGGEEDFLEGILPATKAAEPETGQTKAAQKLFGTQEVGDTGFQDLDVGGEEEEFGEPESLAALKSRQAAQPPAAVPVELDERKLADFFRVATGTPFDPQSSKDRDYMGRIKRVLKANPDLADLSPRRFALKLYGMA